jgi:peptidoglycan/LPS O-acetylase OafA/YrhL
MNPRAPALHQLAGGSTDRPPIRRRPGWYTLVGISPAILVTVGYAVLEHRYYSRGGGDALNSLANGLYLLPLGFIASLVVGVLSAGWAVRNRPPHRSAALVWVVSFLWVLLANVCLMFGGCVSVLWLRST